MFKQVKFISGTSLTDLEEQINVFLSGIDCDTSINYIRDYIVLVETNTTVPTHICCECAFWDDGGNCDALEGECPVRKLRRRYNDPACGKYEGRKGR